MNRGRAAGDTSPIWVVVTQVFHPDTQATGKLLGDLCVELAARGVRCQVLAGFPAEDRERTGAVPRSERWRGVDVRRGGLKVPFKRSLVWRLLGYASFTLWQCGRLLFATPRGAQVLVVTNPPFSPAVVALCSCLRRWRFAVLLHDVYPDGLIAVGAVADGALIARMWRRANRWTWGRAERLFVLGRDMAELLQNRYQIGSGKIVCVPNWNPHDLGAQPVAAEATRLWARLGFPAGTFVVQYSGNMGLWHDIDALVQAAALLKAETDIVFLMIGGGRRLDAARRLAESLGCDNMRWLSFQPETELGDTLACCHLGIVSQREGLVGVAVPSKIYGIMGAGRAILAAVPSQAEAARVVEEDNCGSVVPPSDPAAIASAISWWRRNDEARERAAGNAWRAVREKYALGVIAKRYQGAWG
ncbi:glycosyltransferase family 4 protein [Oleiharenicola sp. Vm1]|uniref:glycosyltransferase family 4 protein n=1 Tax=Oleiharenicola sp. Vm1 TaxID=3398393 RepID=UPI0039F4E29C